jgi:hypothetical protein
MGYEASRHVLIKVTEIAAFKSIQISVLVSQTRLSQIATKHQLCPIQDICMLTFLLLAHPFHPIRLHTTLLHCFDHLYMTNLQVSLTLLNIWNTLKSQALIIHHGVKTWL